MSFRDVETTLKWARKWGLKKNMSATAQIADTIMLSEVRADWERRGVRIQILLSSIPGSLGKLSIWITCKDQRRITEITMCDSESGVAEIRMRGVGIDLSTEAVPATLEDIGQMIEGMACELSERYSRPLHAVAGSR
jgi:hypothetical protein